MFSGLKMEIQASYTNKQLNKRCGALKSHSQV